jgi:hypothetical protein
MWLVACITFIFLSLIELGLVMQTIACLDRGAKKYRIEKTEKFSFWPRKKDDVILMDENFPGELQIKLT